MATPNSNSKRVRTQWRVVAYKVEVKSTIPYPSVQWSSNRTGIVRNRQQKSNEEAQQLFIVVIAREVEQRKTNESEWSERCDQNRTTYGRSLSVVVVVHSLIIDS